MAMKTMSWKTKGMNRDLSVSAFNPEFSFENVNLRLSTNEGNTLMSWVNEKGTAHITVCKETDDTEDDTSSVEAEELEIAGTCIGTAVLNHYLVLFVTGGNGQDSIYRLKYKDTAKTQLEGKALYTGNLGFDAKYPIETLVSYEAENIQKVYWTDGKNQPRVINIVHDYDAQKDGESYNPFDFIPELQLEELVTVEKLLGANGSFAPGVIQYCFTYYNKYGQESNIFYTTPLYYISYRDRGASPEDKVENAFKITVRNVDTHFDYLRIYSLQRTSIDGTPIAKRIQDISLKDITGNTVTYIDTGVSGDSIAPTDLLYKGGEEISAKTMGQKDDTLFFGNLKTKRPYVESSLGDGIQGHVEITVGTRTIRPTLVSDENYKYSNQLTSYETVSLTEALNTHRVKARATADDSSQEIDVSVPCSGFKTGDTYRLGVQFQWKNGQWSNPIYIEDDIQNNRPSVVGNTVILPTFQGTLKADVVDELLAKEYRKVRGLVVFPSIQDRRILCQGVMCPTLYTGKRDTDDKNLNAQSSWFFRPLTVTGTVQNSVGAVQPSGDTDNHRLPYADRGVNSDVSPVYNPNNPDNSIKQVEVQGSYDFENQFAIKTDILTLHSPDLEFNDYMPLLDFSNTNGQQVGYTTIIKTLSDIDIQTESPTVSNAGGGFIHKSFVAENMYGIVSGLFYDDYCVDDLKSDSIHAYDEQHSSCKWLVYLWNKTGSLNNDINRPSDKGTPSAVLKKKVVSNLRFADVPSYYEEAKGSASFQECPPQLFDSNEATIVKLNDKIYMGNIDTLLNPDHTDGQYFAALGDIKKSGNNSAFTGTVNWKTFSTKDDSTEGDYGLWHWTGSLWENQNTAVGDKYLDLVIKKDNVRMKYKSTPHLVCKMPDSSQSSLDWSNAYSLPVVEIVRTPEQLNEATLFGGKSQDALRENNWLPCGEPVTLKSGEDAVFNYSYGDTYFQRWDCLKTYPFTREDINQVVEIGSFMLETRLNIDGRYDRNRGQVSNINMSPQNFNLFNPVYTQRDNFFTYKIVDEDSYENTSFPNQLTWSLTKTSGADIDLWTNITMGSVLELDGDKGELNKIVRLNDQLLAFQDTGISQILYNENVQINSTDGVPIEIANSGKVQGKRYLSNTIGCGNKWSLTSTPSGIYFMDNNVKSIYLFNGNLANLSQQGGVDTWCKNTIPLSDKDNRWTPQEGEDGFKNFVSYYDKLNQDVLFIDKETALAYSEKLTAFTSFYDYGHTPYFCNMDDTGIWVRNDGKVSLWKHQAGKYCRFFDENKPYSTTLIANDDMPLSKVFTNLEFKSCVDGDGVSDGKRFTPTLPFDYIEAWNEYQHGLAYLKDQRGNKAMQHHTLDKEGSLKRKFRLWRCDIPRDNAEVDEETESGMNIYRSGRHVMDRMRNPWLYLKLQKDAADKDSSLERTETHSLTVSYFE